MQVCAALRWRLESADCSSHNIVRVQLWLCSRDCSQVHPSTSVVVQVTRTFTHRAAGSAYASWLNSEFNIASLFFFCQTAAFTLPLAQSSHTKSRLVICISFASTTNCRCHCVANCNYQASVCVCVCACVCACVCVRVRVCVCWIRIRSSHGNERTTGGEPRRCVCLARRLLDVQTCLSECNYITHTQHLIWI